jgi:hypothetical protein
MQKGNFEKKKKKVGFFTFTVPHHTTAKNNNCKNLIKFTVVMQHIA